jgi:hypothetical protein
VSTSIHDASPLQLAERIKHRDRMRRIAERAYQAREILPAVIEPTPMVPEPVDVIALVPEDLTPVPPCAVRVSWFAERIGVDRIKRAVAKEYNTTCMEIDSDRRTKEIVRPRQVAMYLAKTMTLMSLPQIARRFNGKDHTTILHGVRKIEKLVAVDPELAAKVQIIRDAIMGEAA